MASYANEQQRIKTSGAIVPRLAGYLGLPGQPLPADMPGATIRAIGTLAGADLEGGGLVIDYVPVGEQAAKRLLLAFSELGMWIDK